MSRFWIAAACLTAAASLLAAPGSAQLLPDLDLRVGISAGPNALPGPLRAPAEPDQRLAGGMAMGARVAVGLYGPFSLEARGGLHSGDRQPGYNVLDGGSGHLGPVPVDFPVSLAWDLPLSDAESHYSSLDARLRADFGQGRRHAQVLTLGAGTLRNGPAFLVGSMGYRRDDAIRWGVDLDLVGYRMPWTTVTMDLSVDPEDPTTILAGEPRYSDFRIWQVGVGVAAVIEVRIF